MATSLLALLDDIASLLDDVSTMTGVAARKTAGVLGDDLALNAQQVTGVRPERELPVVWAVARGSLRNKAILVPAALAVSALAPWAVTPLMMIGGGFLCFEGFEKIVHTRSPGDEKGAAGPTAEVPEEDKIKGAIRTDFILSAEIIVLTLGTVAGAPLVTRLLVLVGVGLLMTVGVYGLVAAIVKLDDAGLSLRGRAGEGASARAQRALGAALLWTAPRLLKLLSVVGTAAMFLVGGGILTHALSPLHALSERAAHAVGAVPGVGGLLAAVVPGVIDGLTGVLAGALVWLVVQPITRWRQRRVAARSSHG